MSKLPEDVPSRAAIVANAFSASWHPKGVLSVREFSELCWQEAGEFLDVLEELHDSKDERIESPSRR